MLRYDTRGAGMSSKVRGRLTIDTMADDIAGPCSTSCGIKGKVALAGVAVGGAIALHFASRHAARASAVVVGRPGDIDREGPPVGGAGARRRDRGERHGDRRRRLDAERLREKCCATTKGALYATYRARWLGNDPGSYATIYRMLAATDLTDEMTRLTCPVLVIGGQNSTTRARQP